MNNVCFWNIQKNTVIPKNGVVMRQKVFECWFTMWVWMFISMKVCLNVLASFWLKDVNLQGHLLCLLGIYVYFYVKNVCYDVVCSVDISQATQNSSLWKVLLFSVYGQLTTQSAGLDGFTARGECWSPILHSSNSLLDLTDWLWERNCWFSWFMVHSSQFPVLDRLAAMGNHWVSYGLLSGSLLG